MWEGEMDAEPRCAGPSEAERITVPPQRSWERNHDIERYGFCLYESSDLLPKELHFPLPGASSIACNMALLLSSMMPNSMVSLTPGAKAAAQNMPGVTQPFGLFGAPLRLVHSTCRALPATQMVTPHAQRREGVDDRKPNPSPSA